MKNVYRILIVALFFIATVYGTYAVTVQFGVGDDTYHVSVDTDPTVYNISAQMLRAKYDQYLYLENIDDEVWFFHFNYTSQGQRQAEDFAEVLDAVRKVDSQWFATSDTIYRCDPEYITQISKWVLTCNEFP